MVKLLGTVAPRMGVKSIDSSLISSIEEEVSPVMLVGWSLVAYTS